MSDPPTRLTIYADYVCPFCYLGRQSLELYRSNRDAPLEVDWRPFDLRSSKRGPDGTIDHSVDDGKDEAYYEQVNRNVERLKAEYGADTMRSIHDVPDVDSLNAQVASAYVQSEQPELWDTFDAAIFEALWVDGRDIGDPAVLTDLAASVGLDADAISEAMQDEALREEVTSAFEDAHRRRITGVPTFIMRDHMARGAVPPEQLRRLVEGD